MRVTNVSPHPLGAYRLGARSVVAVDGGGLVTILDADSLEAKSSFALGAGPSAMAPFPDGAGLLVALGGGSPKERGATAALITGDPPAITAKIQVGPGAHAAAVSRSGKLAAVGASYAKSVVLLERK